MLTIGHIKKTEFKLFYQPQVTADGAEIVGLEALIRHEDPEKGLLPPSAFIPAFTHAELEDLDWWVLDEAAKDMDRWPGKLVSINISATQLQRDDFASRVLNAIAAAGRDPQRYELEIVESSMIADFDMAAKNVTALRKAGIRIALDDFGTGFSSLTYLLKFPLDKVKIDRSFIEQCHTLQGASIIQAVVALARASGLKLTAEGVETEAQQRFLRSVGCHYLQGYLFSKPVCAEEIERLIAGWSPAGSGPAAKSATPVGSSPTPDGR